MEFTDSIVEKLVRPEIRNLNAYSSARSIAASAHIFLDANEAANAPKGSESICNYNRYPEPQPAKLGEKLAQNYSVPTSCLLVSRGADEAIDVIVRTFCKAGIDNIIITPPTYGFYKVVADIQDIQTQEIPLFSKNFGLDIVNILKAVNSRTKIVFICNPNNPTGNSFKQESISEIVKQLQNKCLVVVDEAYIEYSQESSLAPKVLEFDNLIVLRTLSKAFGLAGARCGAAIANPKTIKYLRKVIAPYPLSQPSIDSIMQKLLSFDIETSTKRSLKIKKDFTRKLQKYSFIKRLFPSDTNFLLLHVTDSRALTEFLKKREILVRNRSESSGLKNCLRITIGDKFEMTRLLENLDDWEALQ